VQAAIEASLVPTAADLADLAAEAAAA